MTFMVLYSFAALAWIVLATVLAVLILLFISMLIYFAIRFPYLNHRRYWKCHAARFFYFPYLHLTCEYFGPNVSLGLEVGWLTRWAAIEWNFQDDRFEDEDEIILPMYDNKEVQNG